MAETSREEVLSKAFKGSKDDIRPDKPDYLVIEEHIETEKLEAEPKGGKKDEPFITCGTLIIRKQDSDSKPKPIARSRSSSRSASKDSKRAKNNINQELSTAEEKQLIRDSYQMLQEMLESKMASALKEKSKSCSPYPTKKVQSTDSVPDNNTELDPELNNEENLFPDFSVSVMKFQDAIESFSHAIFQDVLEDSYNDNQILSSDKAMDNNHDHAGASAHNRYKELVGPSMITETSVDKLEAEVVEEPIVEKFASQLQANHDAIENILNSIDPVVIDADNDNRVPVIEEAFIAENTNLTKTPSSNDINNSFCLTPKMEHKLDNLAHQILVDTKSELCQPKSNHDVIEDILNSIDPVVMKAENEFRIPVNSRSLAQQILEESKSELGCISNVEEVKKETVNATQVIPEICITNDSADCKTPTSNGSSKEPTWISIPIIRGHSMPEQTNSQVSIQEMSESENFEVSNSSSPVITEGKDNTILNGRKTSEPVKTTIQIEELQDGTSKNSKISEKNISDIHIAFSRHVEDLHEEAGAFVPVICEGEVSQVSDAIQNYKKAQISVEETLKYDEEIKDVCEYKTDQIQPEQESKFMKENNLEECESQAILLNSNNLSEVNLDTNELRSEAVNMKAMNRSKKSAKIQEHEVKNSTMISETNSEHTNESTSIESKRQAVTSCNSQQSKENEPGVGWVKAFAMVVTGAIILTYCLVPSDNNPICEARTDNQGHQISGCSTDGYVGLSRMNYEDM